jgi:hypothetical protein
MVRIADSHSFLALFLRERGRFCGRQAGSLVFIAGAAGADLFLALLQICSERRAETLGAIRLAFFLPFFCCRHARILQAAAGNSMPKRQLAHLRPVWHKPAHSSACCGSSVVEHIIGNDEVGSSILPRSTIYSIISTSWILQARQIARRTLIVRFKSPAI